MHTQPTSTTTVQDILANRMAQFKQTQSSSSSTALPQAYIPTEQKHTITIKPASKSWPDLLTALEPVLDADGLYRTCILRTVRALYDQGYGAELETAAELAIKLANKKPASHYFARSVSKRAGNWATKTLAKVHEVWEVRKNALEVIEKLKLDSKITNYILSLSWKYKNTIIRFLSIATEKGYGITNPAGYFFGIIKTAQATT
ncbi:MAG TPA: hypothetical protein VFT53_05175 [Candidatus Saccharimonadales bacterium]|nr:hypothetical protein [Candidatus Saccharimonadales bacterium]